MTATIISQEQYSPNSGSQKHKRVLILVHNHPLISPGGSEIFAYDLFKSIRENTDYQPFFLAATFGVYRQARNGTLFQNLVDSPDEMLFWGGDFDYFYQSQKVMKFMYSDFKRFLQELQPDVIHFHHSLHIGLEALQVARKALPNVKIIYTLHEFLLMCFRDGQMVFKHNNGLCEYASPSRCNRCFPEISPQEFKMREIFIKAHLELVDKFVSPSYFLAKRFTNWGMPEAKMIVLENGRQLSKPSPHRQLLSNGKRNVFGFFGQINPYKGVLLALEAVDYLLKHDFTDFRLELFGSIELQAPEFEEKFFNIVNKYKDNVSFHGRYRNHELPEIIQQIDWVIIPSTWWENSPLVIQEVFMHKRPIISSDIGGMAEKVENNVTGLHFKVRNAISLAATMKKACLETDLWEKLVANIGPRLSIEDCAKKYVSIYESL